MFSFTHFQVKFPVAVGGAKIGFCSRVIAISEESINRVLLLVFPLKYSTSKRVMDDWKLRTKTMVRLERSAKHCRIDWKCSIGL